MSTYHRYLSTVEVQRELGLSSDHVEELIASGRLPAFRILGQWRIDRELLEQMIDDLYEESAETARRPVTEGRGNPESARPATALVGAAITMGTGSADPPRDPPARLAAVPAGLTDQQGRILRLVGLGMSNAEIADRLSLEISTVKSHVSRILQRCALRDREHLIVLAWRSGLVCHDDWEPSSRSAALTPDLPERPDGPPR